MDWFNRVDAAYRADLRELNELNFARFDAKLEHRTGELRSAIAALEHGFDAKLEQRSAELRAALERRLGEQTRWLFGAWAVVLAAVVGL